MLGVFYFVCIRDYWWLCWGVIFGAWGCCLLVCLVLGLWLFFVVVDGRIRLLLVFDGLVVCLFVLFLCFAFLVFRSLDVRLGL